MKLISEYNIIFIEGTFKSNQKTFQQIVNIIRYINNTNLTPIISIVMKSKNEQSYLIYLI